MDGEGDNSHWSQTTQLVWLLPNGLSHPEVQMFMFHSGFGWEDARMYRSMVYNQYEDTI